MEDQSYEERQAARAERRRQRQEGTTTTSEPDLHSTAQASHTEYEQAHAVRSPPSHRASVHVSKPATDSHEKGGTVDNRRSLFLGNQAEVSSASSTSAASSSGAASKRISVINVVIEKCDICGKTVYPLEKIEADGKKYHKTCFKCEQCKKTLSLGNYAALSGKFYCKPHFKQLFRLKGNYDEGFGRTLRKNDWINKPDFNGNEGGDADAEIGAGAD